MKGKTQSAAEVMGPEGDVDPDVLENVKKEIIPAMVKELAPTLVKLLHQGPRSMNFVEMAILHPVHHLSEPGVNNKIEAGFSATGRVAAGYGLYKLGQYLYSLIAR